jgi:hypothetical protein
MGADPDLAHRRGEEDDGFRGRRPGDGSAAGGRNEQDRRGE